MVPETEQAERPNLCRNSDKRRSGKGLFPSEKHHSGGGNLRLGYICINYSSEFRTNCCPPGKAVGRLGVMRLKSKMNHAQSSISKALESAEQ
jgi:hypothetical protein